MRCGQDVTVEVKDSQLKEGDNTVLSNRVALYRALGGTWTAALKAPAPAQKTKASDKP